MDSFKSNSRLYIFFGTTQFADKGSADLDFKVIQMRER